MIYEPEEDSFLLEKYVKKYSKNKNFLDMGASSGIQSKAALKSGAKSVTAVDIQEDAIWELKKQGINCIKSDLFSKVPKKQKFDTIAFNPPYLPKDELEDKYSRTITTGGKKGDEITRRFLRQASKHLEKGGVILLLLSSLTPNEEILRLLKKLGLKKEIIGRKKLFMEELSVWKITKNYNKQ